MKEGWKMVKLGEVCEKTKNIKWQDIATEEIYRYIDLTSVDRETSSILETQSVSSNNAPSRAKQIVSKGDILFATTRPTLKRVCIIPDRFEGDICSTGFCVLRPKNTVLSNWIYYALKDDSFMTYITPLQKGASYPAVTDNEVKNYVVPLPPLEEQHRIVGILDAAFTKIDALKKNAEENLKNAKALFQQVLAQELQPKEGWLEKKLGEVCNNISYGTSLPSSENGIYKYLRMNNITLDGTLDLNNLKYITVPDKELAKCMVEKGDLLFNRTNSHELVGKSCVFENDEKMVIAGYIIRIRLNKEIAPKFANYYINLQRRLGYLKPLIVGAVHQANISAKSIQTINFVYPSLEEQHRIVHTLDTLNDKCRRLEQIAQQTIRECDALKQSILRRAFSGEL